jgi:dipeptidyl aminopeptidase/acylaminoacyl peptidase
VPGPEEAAGQGVYELPLAALPDGRLLVSRESPHSPPNYLILDELAWGAAPAAAAAASSRAGAVPSAPPRAAPLALTAFAHPQPALRGVSKQLLTYSRDDGVALSGDLYLPAGYDRARDGALPCLLWAYPREFKDGQAAGQLRDSPYRYFGVEWKGPLFMLARGWAVLDGPAFPILGREEEEPNDTFIAQLCGSAAAAVDALVACGVGERGRMAVGGHSYGAFMTAHLLSHTTLFRAGIARSGA